MAEANYDKNGRLWSAYIKSSDFETVHTWPSTVGGFKKKKKGKKTLHFARLPLRILQKSLKLFALLWEGVWQQYAATSISTEEIPLVIRRNWF